MVNNTSILVNKKLAGGILGQSRNAASYIFVRSKSGLVHVDSFRMTVTSS